MQSKNHPGEISMTDYSILQTDRQPNLRSRSMGVKLIVVCGLALMMYIPTFFVEGLVDERTQRADGIAKDISSKVGGQQTFLGPTLAIPYSTPLQPSGDASKRGVYLVFPTRASATVNTATQEWHRTLLKVPVFQADLKMNAEFDLTGVPAAAPQGTVLDWSRAEFVVGVSDARGAQGDATLAADGKTSSLVPAETSETIAIGSDQNQTVRLTLFGAKAGDIAKPNAHFTVESSMRFSGAQRLAVLAYGKTTHLTAQGDWRTPGFDGAFFPIKQSTSSGGFSAEWSVPFIARGVRAEGPADSITSLGTTALGISFIELVDPYHSVDRSLKYVLLFMGLVFLSYFIFEVTSGKRLHPAQYLLVGIAQIIFYLLLLSLAERIGFDFGFLIAGGATVTLLATNAGWIFASRRQGARAFAVFSLLYTLIYSLLRLEDNALLVGAVVSFAAVAAAMYFTRKIDWYSSLPASGAPEQQTAPPSPRTAA
jgi:inner membrane protein